MDSQESDHNFFKYIRTRTAWTRGFLPAAYQDCSLEMLAAFQAVPQPALAGALAWTQGVLAGSRVPLILIGPSSAATRLACAAWNALAPSVPDRARYDDALRCGTADNIAFVSGNRLPQSLLPSKPWNAHKDGALSAEHLRTCLLCGLTDLDLYPRWNESSLQLCGLIKDRVSTNALPTILAMDMSLAAFARRHGEYGEAICAALREAGGVFVGIAAPGPGSNA